MIYFIFHTGIRSGAFLNTILCLSNYTDLIVGRFSYLELVMKNLPCLQNGKILYTGQPLNSSREVLNFLSEENPEVQHSPFNDIIVYYDLRYFPSDPQKLNNILCKALYADTTITFYQSIAESEQQFFQIFVSSLKHLRMYATSPSSFITDHADSVSVDLTHIVVDLENSMSLLELFANNFSARHFNTICSDGNYFSKTSTQREKMENEYQFLLHVPSDLKPFFPHVGKFFGQKDRWGYQIEKIFMIDAGKCLINGVFSKKFRLQSFLDRIYDYLNLCPQKSVASSEFKQKMKSMFVDKLKERLHQTQALDIVEKLDQVCRLSGYNSFSDLSNAIINDVECYITRTNETELVFSHGDLFFSNMLYDVNTTQLKLVDPRGISRDMNEAFLPPWYDLAKLSHSFMGLYDLIVYDLVTLRINENIGIDVIHDIPDEWIQLIKTSFCRFVERLGYDLHLIRLFESTLFVSMVPLHCECEKHMVAQTLQAVHSFETYKNRHLG